MFGKPKIEIIPAVYRLKNGDFVTVRELNKNDLKQGFLETLDNLTPGTSSTHPKRAGAIFNEIKRFHEHNKKILVAAKSNGEIVGTASLLMELKFIHDGGLVGHIEDVATRQGYEKLGIGGILRDLLPRLASEYTCRIRKGSYKIILDCHEKNVGFYEKGGFRPVEICVRKNLE